MSSVLETTVVSKAAVCCVARYPVERVRVRTVSVRLFPYVAFVGTFASGNISMWHCSFVVATPGVSGCRREAFV